MTTLKIAIIDQDGVECPLDQLTSVGAESLLEECRKMCSDLEDIWREGN